MSNKKYVFVGPACSGKTTIINEFVSEKKLKFYDIMEVMQPYLDKYGHVTNSNKGLLDEVVGKFIDSFAHKSFDVLEFATGEYLPKVLDALKSFDVVVVYCKCDRKICDLRMESRERKINKSYLDYQFSFSDKYYSDLEENYDFSLIVLDTNNLDNAYFRLKEFISNS
ncbi:MAG: hypothetical protein AABW73_01955 [Nanoarchaeota archaeon]